jgi:hypothetical protein
MGKRKKEKAQVVVGSTLHSSERPVMYTLKERKKIHTWILLLLRCDPAFSFSNHPQTGDHHIQFHYTTHKCFTNDQNLPTRLCASESTWEACAQQVQKVGKCRALLEVKCTEEESHAESI